MALMRSWVESANRAGCDFPLNNLPCGVFSRGEEPHCGMAIGDFVLDLTTLEAEGLVRLEGGPLLDVPFWNEVMEAGPEVWASLRAQVTGLLTEGASKRWLVEDHLVALKEVTLHLPFLVSEFTDFFSGAHHARSVGPLPEAWLHMPLGYAGRASSVVVSGTGVVRPWGQIKGKGFDAPVFQPSRRLDFEAELGAVLGQGTVLGQRVSVEAARGLIFGHVLLNDWSARDIQAWESQPFGPLQSKSMATTISPWIVMSAALEPFRVAAPAREVALLPHLADQGPDHLAVTVEVALTRGGREEVVARVDAGGQYFSAAQQVAQLASSGAALSVGDLVGSGTISGPGAPGCILEMTGEARKFLADGDVVTLRGHAQGEGYRLGFGTCMGQILPAQD